MMKNAVEIVYILVQKGPTRLTLFPQAKNGRSYKRNISTITGLWMLIFECQVGKEVISLRVKGF